MLYKLSCASVDHCFEHLEFAILIALQKKRSISIEFNLLFIKMQLLPGKPCFNINNSYGNHFV